MPGPRFPSVPTPPPSASPGLAPPVLAAPARNRRRAASRRRVVRGEVGWHLPDPKTPGTFKARPFAYTTRATSFLIEVLAEDGMAWSQVARAAIYDHDARHVALGFVAVGHGSTPAAQHLSTGA